MRNNQQWIPFREQSGPSELWGVQVLGSSPHEADQVIIKASTKLDAGDCQLICATHNAALASAGEKVLWCESLVNRAGEPIVQLTFGSEMAQLGIREARHHVGAMNEAIEAAMSDAVIVRFVRQVLLADQDQETVNNHTHRLLQMFRDYREELTKPTPLESEIES